MKRLAICLIMICCIISISVAQNKWDEYWLPGEYTIELTEEDRAKYRELYLRADENTSNSILRQSNEQYTLEKQYEDYLNIQSFRDIIYDDVGPYIWTLGLPDEKSILPLEAYAIACKVLYEREHIDASALAYCYPWFNYEMSYEQPCWIVNFLDCSDKASLPLPYVVMIYAYDGNVGGYSVIRQTNG